MTLEISGFFCFSFIFILLSNIYYLVIPLETFAFSIKLLFSWYLINYILPVLLYYVRTIVYRYLLPIPISIYEYWGSYTRTTHICLAYLRNSRFDYSPRCAQVRSVLPGAKAEKLLRNQGKNGNSGNVWSQTFRARILIIIDIEPGPAVEFVLKM